MKSTLTQLLIDQYLTLPAPDDDQQHNRILRELLITAVENAEAETELRAVAAAAWCCPRRKRTNNHCFGSGGSCTRNCLGIREFRQHMALFEADRQATHDALSKKVEATNARIRERLQSTAERNRLGASPAATAPGRWSECEQTHKNNR